MRHIKGIRGVAPYYLFHRAIIKVMDIVSNILPKALRDGKLIGEGLQNTCKSNYKYRVSGKNLGECRYSGSR